MTVCDECGHAIPDTAEMVNTYHAESCSLHPNNVVEDPK